MRLSDDEMREAWKATRSAALKIFWQTAYHSCLCDSFHTEAVGYSYWLEEMESRYGDDES